MPGVGLNVTKLTGEGRLTPWGLEATGQMIILTLEIKALQLAISALQLDRKSVV